MVELMLHDTGQIAVDPLVVRSHILVEILHVDAFRACDVLTETGNRQASFLKRLLLLVVIFKDMGIHKRVAEALVLREIVFQHIQVDDNHTDGLADLRSSKTHATGIVKRLKHVTDQLRQRGVAWVYILSHLAEHRLTISIDG